MSEDYFFSNYSDKEFEIENENNSFFLINEPNYIPNIPDINCSLINNDNSLQNSYKNPITFKNNIFTEGNFNQDHLKLSPIPIPINENEDNSSKPQMNVNITSSNNNNNISLNGSNSSSTKDKSLLKKDKNNYNITNNNNQIFDGIDEFKNNNKNNNDKDEKNVLTKKRKPRIHLEDLDIDPEIIKDKKFQKIGDKVILSKNKVITEDDKKEIKAIRNRISAQKNRDKKKIEYFNLKERIQFLTEEINRKIQIIEKYEKICCSQCKLKIIEIQNKKLEDNDANNNIYEKEEQKNNISNEGLVLEEEESFFSSKKNSFIGKTSGFLLGLVFFIGIILCFFEGKTILNNKNKANQELLLTGSYQGTLRHLSNNIFEKNENDINGNEENEDINKNKNNNMPISVESFNKNNFLQICHDKFTWEIYSNLQKKKPIKSGNLLKKRYNQDSILNNQVCIDSNNIIKKNYIINNSSIEKNLPIKENNIILNNSLSNKIISVYVKDYESLKRYDNERSLPLQEQIETEAKNSEDGCVYLQMIIPKETMKCNLDKNGTYSEFENNFFEIRCKIFAFNNYDPGISH